MKRVLSSGAIAVGSGLFWPFRPFWPFFYKFLYVRVCIRIPLEKKGQKGQKATKRATSILSTAIQRQSGPYPSFKRHRPKN